MKIRKWFALVTVLMMLFPLIPAAVSADTGERTTLKVAFPIVEGLSQRNEDGTPKGLVVDFLEEISNYTGWEYEYLHAEPNELLDDFRAGKYDLMGGQYYNEAWTVNYGYPEYNTGYSKSVILARWDDDTVNGFETKSLDGKTIGVYVNAKENIRRLNQFLVMQGLNCTIKEYTYSDMQVDGNLFRFLENEEVDLLLGNSADAQKGFRAVATFDSQPYYIVTRPNDTETLAMLNFALEKIYDSNPNFAVECYQANFDDIIKSNIVLNEEERQYIESNTKVKIAIPNEFHPFYCVDVAEEHNGIVYDMLNEITAKTGLQFEIILTETYAQSLEKVQNGDADILGFFPDGKTAANEKGLAVTQSFATLSRMLVKNKTVSYPNDNLTIGILEGRVLPEDIKVSKVVYYPTMTEALYAVDRGKIDLAYGISSKVEQDIQKEHFTKILPIALTSSKSTICFAVKKPAETPLFTILNKAINMVGAEKIEAITRLNVQSIGIGSYSFMDLIYSDPLTFLLILVAILVLLFTIVVLVVSFRYRSANMKLELEKSNADGRAKSDFLSRMSHEIRTPMNAILGLTDLTSRQQNIPPTVKVNLDKINSSSRYLLSLLNDILDMSRLDSGMMNIAKDPFSMSLMLSELESMMSGEATRREIEFNVVKNIKNDLFTGDTIRLKQVLTNLVTNAIKFTPSGGKVELSVCEVVEDTSSTLTFSVTDNGLGIPVEDQKRIFKAFEQSGTNYNKSQGTGLGLAISQNIVRLMGGEIGLKSEVNSGSVFYFSIVLPHAGRQEPKRSLTETQLLAGMHILMAEDNDLNAEIATDLLELAGAEVVRVENGNKVVGAFSERPEYFHAILMDIHMPELNGIEATRMIRRLNHPNAEKIKIIAMTANSFREDVEMTKDAGMNDFLSKPFDTELLYSVLAKVYNK